MNKIKLRYFAPVFAAGMTAAGMALAAPAAANDRSCSGTGTTVICERDGHSSVATHRPPPRGPMIGTGFGPRGGGGMVYGPMPSHYPFR